jgi:hypothetical protein
MCLTQFNNRQYDANRDQQGDEYPKQKEWYLDHAQSPLGLE